MPEPQSTTIPDIDPKLVTVGKPGDGGCCYTSLADSPTLPTDATTKVSTLNLESLGELSKNGFTESIDKSFSELKGWHNTILAMGDGDESHKYKSEFLEINRPTVAKLRYGFKNVKAGDDGSVSQIDGVFGVDVTVPLVFDELESNGYLRRTVIRKAHVTKLDDVGHQRGDLMFYGFEFTVLDPGDGKPAWNVYRAKPVGA